MKRNLVKISESSERLLNNDLDVTGEHTDEETLINNKVVRSKNREYELVCSIRSFEAAKSVLKTFFFDSTLVEGFFYPVDIF